jgi:hypothetical protein
MALDGILTGTVIDDRNISYKISSNKQTELIFE